MADAAASLTMTLDRQMARGFITLPWIPNKGITLLTGFSSDHAKQNSMDPFYREASPFDPDAVANVGFSYRQAANCEGSFVSTETMQTRNSSEHLSVSLGVTVGCKYLSGSVTGSYDETMTSNKDVAYTLASLECFQDANHYTLQSCKSSLRSAYRAGALRVFGDVPLSAASIKVLQAGGLDAFKAQYGDYYVGALLLGGDAGVCVSQKIEVDASVEKLKVVAQVHVLCFTKEKTIAEKDISSETIDMSFAVTAFDSLESANVALNHGLDLDSTQMIASEFAGRTENLDMRVITKMEKWQEQLMNKEKHGWDLCRGIISDGLAVEMILVPFDNLRGVREFL